MFALSCLRRSLVERNSTSRHPRANGTLRATVALALPVRAKDLRAERSSEHRIIVSLYTYDSAGNTISANSGGTLTTYTYDFHNRLMGVKQGGTVIATYAYDALDRRIAVQETGSTTWTVYNGTSADAMPYGDFNSSGTLLARYVSGPGMVNGAVVDELLARTSSGGATAWYLPDKLDSVRDVVSSFGAALDHVVYDSFGNITTETNATNGDRFKFAGMEFDSTVRQDFDHARWYGSVVGKYLSRDSMGFGAGDTNLYRYVKNDPVKAVDPTGHAESESSSESEQFPPNGFPYDDSDKQLFLYTTKVGKIQAEQQIRDAMAEGKAEAQRSFADLKRRARAGPLTRQELLAYRNYMLAMNAWLKRLAAWMAYCQSRGPVGDFPEPPAPGAPPPVVV